MSNVFKQAADIKGVTSSIVDITLIDRSYTNVFSRLDVSFETKIDYQARCAEFYMFLQLNGLHNDSLLQYKQLLEADKTTKAATKNKKLSVARLFLREMYRNGLLPRDITAGIKNFKQSGLHKTTGLDDTDIKKIRQWIHDGRPVTPKDLRTFTMLMLLAYHGLRQVEVCRLEYEDIDFSKGFAMVLGKGQYDKERVHLHKAVVAMLRAYCDSYGIQSGSLFFSVSNSSYGESLTTRGLRRIVKIVFERLEIDKTVHGFRHYYVTTLVKAYRGDLFRVMRFTRHKSLSMLQTYNDEILHENQYPVHDRIFSNLL